MAVYKDEERGTWTARFYYTDWQGKRRQKKKRGFEKKKDAVNFEADFIAKSGQNPSISLKALSDEFLSDYKVRRSPNSYKLAEANLRIHILPELGKMALNDITPLTIRTWQNKLAQTDKAQSTIKAINTTFQTVMHYAVRYYNLAANPFDKTEPVAKGSSKKQFIEHPVWLKLFSVMQNKHDKAIFSLLYWGGMRVGEVQGLSLHDINFDTGTININKQYSSDRKEISPLKTQSSNRVINIPTMCMTLVEDYIKSYLKPPLYPFTIKTARGLNEKLERYCKRANIDRISVHALRHSHASLLIKQGAAVNLISERLGHTTPTTTLRVYSHVYENQDNELAGMLDTIDTTS